MVSCIKLINNLCKIESVKSLIEGVVKGIITKKNNEFMIIDIGFRSNVRLYKHNLWNYNLLKINQQIDVRIKQFNSKKMERH